MSESGKTVAMGHGAVMLMTPGANLPAYVQAVSGIPILSVERERALAEKLYYEAQLQQLVHLNCWQN